MPFTFSVAEYADMIYVYSFSDRNSVHAVAEYQQCFLNCRIPTQRVFTRVYQTLQDTGTLPGVCTAAARDVNEGIDEGEGIVQMVQSSPRASTRRIPRHLCVPSRESGEHCMQRACIHTMCSESNISELVILLRGWNFASCSMAVASCIVTSCLLTKRNSIVTVSIIHTTLMCGQMWITTPLWKATFNYVLVSVCGVQFWTISWLVLSSWQVVLQERRNSKFCRKNCPDFLRMCLWILNK